MNEERYKMLEARVEAYKNLMGAQTLLSMTGDREQERAARQAADELQEIIAEEHDTE